MIRHLILLFLCGTAFADGLLTDDIRISSTVLGYDLQYRVYLPEGHDALDGLPVLFVTDGPGFLSQGRMHRVLNRMIESEEIEPLVVIFVDARDPDQRRLNRRNSQFLCNADYLSFYVEELIPVVEKAYGIAENRTARTIMGLSFGATNAACFGVFGSTSFSGLAMLSPANHPVPALLPAYEGSPQLPLKIFLSTGKPNDNTAANRRFQQLLSDKGYDMHYVEVREGHNWDNWRPLLDDVLRYFYAPSEQPVH